MRDAGAHLQAERLEVLGDLAGGAELAVAQLGILVDVSPPLDHPCLELVGHPVDIGAKLGADRDRRKQHKQRDGQSGNWSG